VSVPAGIPVPIGCIERELGKLWEQSGEGKTRASLINLAIYNEKEGSLATNAAVIQGIAGEHAMRALLIQADPKTEGSSAEAWISMNCYIRGSKGGEVCSEQVSFRLSGEAARSLQSVVFSHLDSDLPLVLWWQADFRPPIDGKLWRWVDRLIFDSRHWKNPAEQFDLVAKIASLGEGRTVLCDLNWARSLPVRRALAGIFDCPGTLPELRKIRTLRIDHAPEHRTTALLLVGWLAERLAWKLSDTEGVTVFRDTHGDSVTATLHETEGPSISRLLLETGDSSFEVLREKDSDLYVTSVKGTSVPCSSSMVRAPREETREILLSELSRGGRHPLYTASINALGKLWR
jgi:glucose-6-phosphate dehydrogenase assembly protein OpcA